MKATSSRAASLNSLRAARRARLFSSSIFRRTWRFCAPAGLYASAQANSLTEEKCVQKP